MKNDEFWEKKEKEIQEKVIYKCMVQYLQGQEHISKSLWSLFFYTEQAIYLSIFPQKNLLLSIFWSDKNSDKQPLDIRIPWNDITKISFPEEKSKIKKIFSVASNLVKVDYLLHQKSKSFDLYFSDTTDIFKNFIRSVNKKLLD